MTHELRFVKAFQQDVMLAYDGPYATDPGLEAAVRREVLSLRSILETAHIPGLDFVGNTVAYKDTRLRIVVCNA